MTDQNPAILLILTAVFIMAVVGVIYILFSRRGRAHLSKEKYQTRWLQIENSISRDNPGADQFAILNADKLLDMALKEAGFKGMTMGERMKSASGVWKNANAVWTAHKIRNRIAHEADVAINHKLARQALAAFKQALKDIGAI